MLIRSEDHTTPLALDPGGVSAVLATGSAVVAAVRAARTRGTPSGGVSVGVVVAGISVVPSVGISPSVALLMMFLTDSKILLQKAPFLSSIASRTTSKSKDGVR